MTAIVSVDPSSKKIAYVVSHDTDENVTMGTEDLPEGLSNRPQACAEATEHLSIIVSHARHYPEEDVYVFIEAPVLGRGGAGATIPQSMVVGSMMAGAYSAGAGHIQLVPVQVWKKDIVGKGNASKDEVAAWLKQHHPSLHRLWLMRNKLGTLKIDQDVIDALAINLYGRMVHARARRIMLDAADAEHVVKKAVRPRRKSAQQLAKTSKQRSGPGTTRATSATDS